MFAHLLVPHSSCQCLPHCLNVLEHRSLTVGVMSFDSTSVTSLLLPLPCIPPTGPTHFTHPIVYGVVESNTLQMILHVGLVSLTLFSKIFCHLPILFHIQQLYIESCLHDSIFHPLVQFAHIYILVGLKASPSLSTFIQYMLQDH